MWIKGELDDEKFYTLKNYKWSKVLTTDRWYNQEFQYYIKGQYTLRCKISALQSLTGPVQGPKRVFLVYFF